MNQNAKCDIFIVVIGPKNSVFLLSGFYEPEYIFSASDLSNTNAGSMQFFGSFQFSRLISDL